MFALAYYTIAATLAKNSNDSFLNGCPLVQRSIRLSDRIVDTPLYISISKAKSFDYNIKEGGLNK